MIWQGLRPEHSKYSDAVALLGEPSSSQRLTNGIVYQFEEGKVRISFLDHRSIISKIRVNPGVAADDLPATLAEARTRYGELAAIRLDKLQGAIFEARGIRLACEEAAPNVVRWVEFFSES